MDDPIHTHRLLGDEAAVVRRQKPRREPLKLARKPEKGGVWCVMGEMGRWKE